MAGVDADAHARFVLHAVDQIAEVFEPESKVRPLPGGVLDHGRHPAGLVEGDVDRLGDPVEALLLGDFLQVAAGMEVQTVESQQFAALHFIEKRCARFLQRLFLGMSEVDEVRVVGQYLFRPVAVGVARLAESVYLSGGERLGHPLTLVLGEERESRGSYCVRIGGRVVRTSRGAYVCSEIFHNSFFQFIFQTKLRIL